MPGDCTLLSLDASHAILTRILRFEDSGLRRRTPVRPMLLTGQTHRSDRSGAAASPSSVLWSSFCVSTKEPCGFLVNHWKPRELGSLRQSPLMTRLPRSPGSTLVLRLNQETIHDFILLFMPPCSPHLTLLATGSLEQAYLSSPHVEASPAMTFRACSSPTPTPVKPNLHLQYLAKNQSTQRCQSLITQGSDHPPVLKPHLAEQRYPDCADVSG
jgi:hypothetical protein